MKSNEYEVVKYEDGLWITFWNITEKRRVKANGPFKYKTLALLDVEALNQKHGKNR